MRHHTEQMRLPRFLWVPFPLGRPFGAPNEPEFQRRVLRSALDLFERSHGPVLEDFGEDAPEVADLDDEGWACPVSFAPTGDTKPAIVKAALDEIARLEPWIEAGEGAGEGGFATLGPFTLREVVEAFGVIARGGEPPEVEGVPLQEWVRLGCDDLHGFAIESSRAQPGRASVRRREDWFWKETAIARLIGETAAALVEHPAPMVRALALRGMVPRAYVAHLVPGADPFI